jgi:hypothetical protein
VRDIHLMDRSEHREIAAELMEVLLELPRLQAESAKSAD